MRSLHNLNLQRCDRVTMAHAVEARVPFLDRNVIAWALRMPAGGEAGHEPEKRLLREAFTGWLPDELLWRAKAEFGDGSGARDVLSAGGRRDGLRRRVRGRARRGGTRAAHEGGVRVLPRRGASISRAISPERTLSRFARA